MSSVVINNAATSCLMSTRAKGDLRTMLCLKAYANERLTGEQDVALMNYFIDRATCDTCIELRVERLSWGPDGCVR